MRMYAEDNRELCIWIENEKLNLTVTEEGETGKVSNISNIKLNKNQIILIRNYLDNYLNKELK